MHDFPNTTLYPFQQLQLVAGIASWRSFGNGSKYKQAALRLAKAVLSTGVTGEAGKARH